MDSYEEELDSNANSQHDLYEGFQNVFCDFLLAYSLDKIDLKNIHKKKLISDDSAGKFYQIIQKDTEQVYGLIIKDRIKLNNPKNTLSFIKQFNSILKINSPLILDIISYDLSDISKTPAFITEFPKQLTLRSQIKAKSSHLNPTQKLIILYGIAAGIDHLHSHNIYNFGLDTSEIFLDENFNPKIGCFEFFKDMKSLFKLNLAPETFLNDEVTNKSNVFSFAIIMYEIITMSLLDDIKNFSLFFKNIVKEKRPELSKDIPICYQNLIKKCWSQEPSQRPTFKEILALFETDKFVKNVDRELFFKYVNSIKNSMGNNDLKIRKINKCYIDTFPLNLEQFSVVKRIGGGGGGINDVFQVRDKKSGNLFCAKVIKDN